MYLEHFVTLIQVLLTILLKVSICWRKPLGGNQTHIPIRITTLNEKGSNWGPDRVISLMLACPCPRISIGIIGTTQPHRVKLERHIKKINVMVLIDNGSNNFVDKNIAMRLNILYTRYWISWHNDMMCSLLLRRKIPAIRDQLEENQKFI